MNDWIDWSDSDSSSASDSDDDSSDASSSSSITTFVNPLLAAIRSRDLEHLREILSQVDEGGSSAVTEDNLHEALYKAAVVVNVKGCRLLWGKLSPFGKQKYFAKKGIHAVMVIQSAVELDHKKILRLVIEEFKWNINQMDYVDMTPLCYAVPLGLEMVRYLLENGANVNQGEKYGPLWIATYFNNIEVCYLLLIKYHANPNLKRRPANEEDYNYVFYPRNTDIAIENGSIEILNMLLECGAWVGHRCENPNYGTSLNCLLSNHQKSHENKIDICHILLEYAKGDRNTAKYMHDTFEFAIQQETGQILLEAGFDPRTAMFCAIRGENLSICQLLVNEYQIDLFPRQQVDENDDSDDETEDIEVEMEEGYEADDENEDGVEAASNQTDTSIFKEDDDDENEQEQDDDDDDDNEQKQVAAATPFVAAARLVDTTILKYFLELWDERFSSSGGGGKNGNDDYLIHVICCDPHVSLQAIQLLVQRHPDSLVVHVVGHGFLPFQLAAIWDASLDVIFYLLQHYPGALHHVGNAAAVRLSCTLPVLDDGDADDGSMLDDDFQARGGGPVKKKAKRTHSS